ncbi:MAG: indolepyruvate oxidoreductase subunit beta [Treponema sp.]|jgi:indolepyruvate ferredoxin oxidoreductase beta subunit|nr:indolepyruvate oxidoreductase subunit beta [Treponema sp.]
MTKSILLVGVGGQGTILASRLLTIGLMEAGFDVKMSEIHGMSQRGGSVSSQVRYGEAVYSPVIERGGADILVSFELMEALRWLEYLKPQGQVIVNDYRINPMPVVSAQAVYPEGIAEELAAKAPTIVVNAAVEALNLGNAKVMNIILLGATIKRMGLEAINWNRIITANVKAAFVDINIRALSKGQELVA